MCALAITAVFLIAGITFLVALDPVSLYFATVCHEESFQRSDEAERLYKSVLTQRERTFGPESEWLVEPLRGLAKFYSKYGNDAERKEAEALYKRALQIKEKNSKKSDSERLRIEVDLASLYLSMKEPEKAEQLFNDALQNGGESDETKSLSQTHIRKGLADAYTQQGKYEKAVPLYETIIPIEEKLWGPGSFYVADMREHLAYAYTKLGNYDKAAPLFQAAVKEFETNKAPHYSKYLAESLEHYAELLRKTGRNAEADALQVRAGKAKEAASKNETK
jgi:tetratricopeptide (TPR) repeat protein